MRACTLCAVWFSFFAFGFTFSFVFLFILCENLDRWNAPGPAQTGALDLYAKNVARHLPVHSTDHYSRAGPRRTGGPMVKCKLLGSPMLWGLWGSQLPLPSSTCLRWWWWWWWWWWQHSEACKVITPVQHHAHTLPSFASLHLAAAQGGFVHFTGFTKCSLER